MDNGTMSGDRGPNRMASSGRNPVQPSAGTASWQLTGKIAIQDDYTGRTFYDLPVQPLPQIGSRSGRVRRADSGGTDRTDPADSLAGSRRYITGTAQWQTSTAGTPRIKKHRSEWNETEAFEDSQERTGRNPFEEPVASPELEVDRNPEMYDKSSEFWRGEQDEPGSAVKTKGKTDRSMTASVPVKPVRQLHSIFLSVVALVLLLTATGLIVFRVREIKVAGCSHVKAETVVACSGITTGNNLLLLNEKKIEEGINANRYLQYVCIEKNVPSSVTIRVKERVPIAYMSYCGIQYVMDKALMVLEEEYVIGSLTGLIEVKGLKPQSCTLGAKIVTGEEQRAVYTELMREIKVLGIENMILEIDISDPLNVYMLISDGMSVSIGDGNNIHAKLRSMLLTHEEVIRRGYTEGSINVSKPENPTYVPSIRS